MLDRPVVRLLLLWTCLALVIGILLWPEWWYLRLSEPFGLQELIWRDALGRYFGMDLAIAAAAGFCAVSFNQQLHRQAPWALRLNRALYSGRYFLLISVLVFICGFRLMLIGFGVLRARPDLATNENASGDTTEVSLPGPIDLIYVDKDRIASAADQLGPELEIKERTEKKAAKTSGEGEGSIGAAKVKGGFEASGEQSQTLVPTAATPARVTLRVIESLRKNGSLRLISRVDIQSKDVKALDSATAILSGYGVKLPTLQIVSIRKELIQRDVKEKEVGGFKENAWVLIKGRVSVTARDSTYQFTFDYVPSLPGRIVFSCDVPSRLLAAGEAQAFAQSPEWPLYIFGKAIRQKEQNSSTQFLLTCLAIFR